MKRLKYVIALLIMFTLVACTNTETPDSNNWVVLPDLNGYLETEVVEQLTALDLNFTVQYADEQIRELAGQFIMYEDTLIGDIVNTEDALVVLVYPEYTLDLIELPDIIELTTQELIAYFNEASYAYVFNYIETEDNTLDNVVLGYANGFEAGDSFDTISAIEIDVYKYVDDTVNVFEVLELEYDGPILDDALIGAEYMDPRGGAFMVTLKYCTDGDTAKFNYPSDIYDAILSSAKSVRFLNMDTEETYSGGEEEWGKPASVYTCSLLNSAESIAIQTDPGDALLDTHGRLLGWIWIQLEVDGPYQLLNYMVVQQGLAQVKYEFGAGETLLVDGITLNAWMHIAEDQAIEYSRGQWGNLIDKYWDYENNQPNDGLWN